jgi:NADH-quinone oxidoreductase subunit J
MFETVVFWGFAAILVFAALRMITTRNPVQAALWLVLCFFTASAIWILLHAEFLAIALVLVYVGAVMVLFLFVVMMLDINFDHLRAQFKSYLPLGIAVGVLVLLEMAVVLIADGLGEVNVAPVAAEPSNTRALGLILYTDYLYPFELAAVILLVAIIAAIALTLRRRKDTRHQNPSQQVKVRSVDRVRLISLPSEPVAPPPAPQAAAAAAQPLASTVKEPS